jgi:hypothetical protein
VVEDDKRVASPGRLSERRPGSAITDEFSAEGTCAVRENLRSTVASAGGKAILTVELSDCSVGKEMLDCVLCRSTSRTKCLWASA